ncbi:MAG TPA: glutathione S-transferase family protein [Conexibacter sp.]|nr:glutathione S-transferase family protein [Conexibacter sp.]
MKLYRAAWSTNCERVALALAHKRLEVESIWIDYGDRSLVERVSGQGLVPVLDDVGAIVHDSPAILTYLDARYPQAPLYPAEPARRAELETFVDWFNLVWKRWPNAIAEELDGRVPPDQRTISLAAFELESALDRFSALLDGRDFLFGDFSAADCIAYPFLKFAGRRDPADDETFHVVLDDHQRLGPQHAPLAAWIERVAALPQV